MTLSLIFPPVIVATYFQIILDIPAFYIIYILRDIDYITWDDIARHVISLKAFN